VNSKARNYDSFTHWNLPGEQIAEMIHWLLQFEGCLNELEKFRKRY
jgi:hypothetical protein